METENTVFVVDDDTAVRSSVAALLTTRGMKVECYASAEEFLAALDPSRPGCLIVDVRMNGISGMELQQRLAEQQIALPVIIITGHGDVPMAVKAMQAGAVTFLEKPCRESELLKNVEYALEKGKRDRELSERRREIQSRLKTLTPDEAAVLEFMMQGELNKRIASELNIGLRTVELRRANIMKKLHADSLAEVIRMVMIARQ